MGPAAFVGSVIDCCEVLAAHALCLEHFAEPVLHLLLARLAPLCHEPVNKVLHLPLDAPTDLFSPARYVEQDSDNKSAPGM